MPKSAGYVSAEYLKRVAEQARGLKQQSYDAMFLYDGAVVLNLGCGPGIDTIPLASRVGNNGSVYGIDMDEAMLAEADYLATQTTLPIQPQHQLGDVQSLPFDDDFFDACRSERLFQVLPNAVDKNQVFREILRVTKPGGRIVLIDTDWATASVDYPDSQLERQLMSYFSQTMRPNGYAGRVFYRWAVENSLDDIEIQPFPFVQFDFSETVFGDWLTNSAVTSNQISQQQADSWLQTNQQLSNAGQFYCCVNLNLVCASTPLD